MRTASRGGVLLSSLLLLSSLIGACSRDFALPADATGHAPTLEGFTPAAAYAFSTLTISGQGFDPEASGNEVRFTGGSATAHGFDAEGRLQVRVPPDLIDGPVSVVTRAGASTPSADSLTFLGRGRLRSGAVAREHAVFHRPGRVLVFDQEPVVYSSLFNEFVSGPDLWRSGLRERPLIVDAYGSWRPPSISVGGGRIWVSDQEQLFSLDPTDGSRREESVPLETGWSFAQVVAIEAAAGLQVWVFEEDITNQDHFARVGLYDPATGSYTLQPWTGLIAPTAVEIVDETTLFLSSFQGTDVLDLTTGAHPGASFTYAPDTMTAWRSGADGRVAVYLWDGRLLILDADQNTALQPADLMIRGAVADLLHIEPFAGVHPGLLIASVPSAGRVVALDTTGYQVLWSEQVGVRPSQLAYDAAMDRLYVADEASNTLEVLRVSDGRSLGRQGLPLYLGIDTGSDRGVALLQHQLEYHDERYLVIPQTPRMSHVGRPGWLAAEALVLVSLSDPSEAVGYRVDPSLVDPLDSYEAEEVVAEGPNTLWVLSEWRLHRLSFGPTSIERRSWAIGEDPHDLAIGPTGLVHFAERSGIVTVDPEQPGAPLATHQPEGSNDFGVLLLKVLDDGRVLAVSSGWEGPILALWESEALASPGGAPTEIHPTRFNEGRGMAHAAEWLDGDLILFGTTQSGEDYVALRAGLDGSLEETVSSVVHSGTQFLTVAPGGSAFLWGDFARVGYSLLEPGQPVRAEQYFRLDILPGGVAFGPDGEQAYVAQAQSNRFLILE
ncbi:MAG: IPT/TIG domain-containing protein [Deltaproteobacteria bacterium]|nr:IPT/TIG domain-containing protein [Deltaproteobacteria bacterium]